MTFASSGAGGSAPAANEQAARRRHAGRPGLQEIAARQPGVFVDEPLALVHGVYFRGAAMGEETGLLYAATS